jgi:ABC-type multidrug transport system ATPase subunit
MSTSSKDSAPVDVRGLIKRYGATTALDGVSLSVEPGELFGVIGPDGAGKSTLFRILVTVILPDAGTATVDGQDVVDDYRTIRRRVGYMPGRFSLYYDLSVRENLEFFASVFGTTVEAEYDLIAPIYSQIEPFSDRRAGALSGGMKQKLALCCALVHRPRVLILDEPTTGVDAVSRVEFWDMLARLKEGGITTLVSTPYMDEAARCDRIALLQKGRLLRTPASPEAVAQSYGATLVRARAEGERADLLGDLRQIEGVRQVNVFGEWVHVTGAAHNAEDGVRDAAALAEHVHRALDAAGWSSIHVEPTSPSVEDVFMALMGDPDADDVNHNTPPTPHA